MTAMETLKRPHRAQIAEDPDSDPTFSHTWTAQPGTLVAREDRLFVRNGDGASGHDTPLEICRHEDAALIQGLSPGDAAMLEDIRDRMLGLKLDVLAACQVCLRSGDYQRLWSEVLELFARNLTSETFALLLRAEALYESARMVPRFAALCGEMLPENVTSGLGELLRIAGHCEKELRFGTMDRAKRQRLKLPNDLIGLGSYFQAIGHPAISILDFILDQYWDSYHQEAGFWSEFSSRANTDITAELRKVNVVVSRRVDPEHADAYRFCLTGFADLQQAYLGATGSLAPIAPGTSAGSDPAGRGMAGPSGTGGNVIEKEGRDWSIIIENKRITVTRRKGMSYIAYLIEHPGREFEVLDLELAVMGMPAAARSGYSAATEDELAEEGLSVVRHGRTKPVLTRKDYQVHREGLATAKRQLEEARHAGDTRRAEQLERTVQGLEASLRADFGLRGRARNSEDPAEKARKRVSKCITETIQQIYEKLPAAGPHLDKAVQRGDSFKYEPEERVTWIVR